LHNTTTNIGGGWDYWRLGFDVVAHLATGFVNFAREGSIKDSSFSLDYGTVYLGVDTMFYSGWQDSMNLRLDWVDHI